MVGRGTVLLYSSGLPFCKARRCCTTGQQIGVHSKVGRGTVLLHSSGPAIVHCWQKNGEHYRLVGRGTVLLHSSGSTIVHAHCRTAGRALLGGDQGTCGAVIVQGTMALLHYCMTYYVGEHSVVGKSTVFLQSCVVGRGTVLFHSSESHGTVLHCWTAGRKNSKHRWLGVGQRQCPFPFE